MKKNKRSKASAKPNVIEIFQQYLRQILDICICVFMLMILVVLPFYNEEGFSHIGTDKATFFKKCIIYGGWVMVPILAVIAVLGIVSYVKNKEKSRENGSLFQGIVTWCKKNLSVTDVFALLYAVSVIVSYLCSSYKTVALWGRTGWYMGLVPQLTAVSVYFLVSKLWGKRNWLVALVLPVSAIVFGLGYLNRFGIYPIDMKIENPQFISTIGNINWYCGYLVSVFFGGMFLFWKTEWKNKWAGILMIGYVAVGFATLVTQGSTSGIMTMAVMFPVLFWMSAKNAKRMEIFWLEMVIFSVTCLITYVLRKAAIMESTYPDTLIDLFTYSGLPIVMTVVSVVFFVWIRATEQKGIYPEKVFLWMTRLVCGGAIGVLVLFAVLVVVNTVGDGVISKGNATLESILTFSPTWGSSRGATWSAGWLCFQEQNWLHRLIGAGPDCMAEFLYNEGSMATVAMVRERFGTNDLTNAHNEWLTILVNMGLFGFLSYVGMIVTAIKRFIQSHQSSMITAACGMCVLAYTVNNMFSFQQSMTLPTIFIIMGIGEKYRK